LQRLVDSLGDRLGGRSVAIDDRNIRLLAYNSHAGDVDGMRIHSIMQRQVPQETLIYVRDVGAYDKQDLFRLPVRPDVELTIERIGMPIRYENTLLGFLWLLASDGPLSGHDAETVRLAAEHAAHVLQRDNFLDELRRGRTGEMMRDLLSGDQRLHGEAAERLIEEEILVAGPVAALVVTLPREADQPLSEKDRLSLALGLEHGCHRAPPRSAIHLERADHGVIVVANTADRDLDQLAVAVHEQVCAASGRPEEDCVVGIGGRRPSLSEGYASYREAVRAADVARVIGVLGRVVRYSSLGVYGLLAELPLDQLRGSVHPGLQRLFDYDDANHGAMAQTLEAFMANAGDVSRVAEALNIHRASVRYRLRRIEKIANIDLSNGDDRLALHLGLKVAQLIEPR
jgi:sugar diacid utilization regulator